MVCYDWTIFGWDTTIWKSGILGCKKIKIEKIAIKVVQMKFLAMNITNQKWSFDIFTVENLQNIFMEHDLYLISYRFLTYKNNLGLYFWPLQCIFGYCYKYTLTT